MDELKLETVNYEAIIKFWFSEPANKQWFKSIPEFDAEILSKYHLTWVQASNNQLDHWQDTAASCLALIIVLDQFPLNMFRGTAKSFSTEAKAISVSRTAISNGFDKLLSTTQLSFLYMPFMHSENLEDQNYSVKLYEQAGQESNLRFAKHHRSIIEKFERFPHRNEILERTNTSEELEYLSSPQAFKG